MGRSVRDHDGFEEHNTVKGTVSAEVQLLL